MRKHTGNEKSQYGWKLTQSYENQLMDLKRENTRVAAQIHNKKYPQN